MSITGEKGQPPVKAGTLVADMTLESSRRNRYWQRCFIAKEAKRGKKLKFAFWTR